MEDSAHNVATNAINTTMISPLTTRTTLHTSPTHTTTAHTHTIHLIRHGQSIYNARERLQQEDPLTFDARLSELGEQQVIELSSKVIDLDVELVVTSPLTRAIQTAVGAFRNRNVPIIVCHLHREILGASCDIGRHPEILAGEFPHLTFSHLEKVWWYIPDDMKNVETFVSEEHYVSNGFYEHNESVEQRIEEFKKWIKSRKETKIAVVGHHDFFRELSGGVKLRNCGIHTLLL